MGQDLFPTSLTRDRLEIASICFTSHDRSSSRKVECLDDYVASPSIHPSIHPSMVPSRDENKGSKRTRKREREREREKKRKMTEPSCSRSSIRGALFRFERETIPRLSLSLSLPLSGNVQFRRRTSGNRVHS